MCWLTLVNLALLASDLVSVAGSSLGEEEKHVTWVLIDIS